ncbi:MAG: DUF1549 domain-containing protein [Planctomycetaceae bacterium]|nr:DUF1549 domain-containing protein [Planctomycetaceae bacterium]
MRGCLLVASLLGIAADAVFAEAPQPTRLTSPQLDALIIAGQSSAAAEPPRPITDEQFLRRISLDLLGRQPTADELATFLALDAPDKREQEIDRLLAHAEFGGNWANYWTDTIAFRVPPPELTFLNYDPFRTWLADQLNANTGWDQIVQAILSATGKVKDNPPVTFVAYHEAHPQRLASETARIFMSLQIGCAQCHDHPFDDWKREQFHELAAYFVRASVKFPWNEGAETEVKDKGKGEYTMPNVADPKKPGKEMDPGFLTGEKIEKGKSDIERRTELAKVIATPTNPWFAKAYVNRTWARLMGRGFYNPVDDFGVSVLPVLEGVHEQLANDFRDSGFDVKRSFRLIMNTQAYQQALPLNPSTADVPFTSAVASKLRGDEVYASLVTAIELPNITPPKMEPTKEIRFPPPPKSTRDIVAETFSFDPSARPQDVARTLHQAMLMMNNDQLQRQIDASPESGTVLSRIVTKTADNRAAVEELFFTVLARRPTDKDLQIALEHLSAAENRIVGFEDLLWSLLNSAEFTTKR